MLFSIRKKGVFMKYLLLFVTMFSIVASAQMCGNWKRTKVVGRLDHNIIDEASGIAFSRGLQNRLYHINDSGDANSVYVTDARGGNTKKIHLTGFRGFDTEDLSYGRCGQGNCLYIGDIGDNKKIRPYIQIGILKETLKIPSSVKIYTKRFRYPDGPHNAEGMAVHPNGDLYIVTKEKDKKKRAQVAKIFRARKEALGNLGFVSTLELVGEIDIPSLLKTVPRISERGKIVTSFDIAPKGNKFVLLTYEMAIEVNTDLARNQVKPVSMWRKGIDYKIVPTVKLPQQEAITYINTGNALLYNTEFSDNGGVDHVELFVVRCE
jgi:hypothetical protein